MCALIASAPLTELIVAGAVRTACVRGTEGGYHVVVHYGGKDHRVSARSRNGTVHPRLFRTLDAASRYLREMGLTRYEVDDSGYVEQNGPQRRDRTEAMKQVHAAANHARRLQEQLAEAIAEARGGQAEWRNGEEVEAWLASWGGGEESPPS